MQFDVDIIFKIAGVGIALSMIQTILKQMGKEDVAHWVTVIGFVLILVMVISLVGNLFDEVQRVFLFQ